MAQRSHQPYKHTFKIEIAPITLGELLRKVSISPSAAPAMLETLTKAEVAPETVHACKEWAPNPHMEAYNTRREKRKHDRELERD